MTATLIDPVRLQALLGPARGRFDVDALAECESTSSVLLDRATAGAPAGSVLVADRQTAGRGRRGRHWLSTPESSLTFSLLWRFEGGIERLAGLSLAVGVAVARALEACGARGIALKWPNDILLGAGKLGGILVELQSEQRQSDPRQGGRRGLQAVIGIGLNLQAPGPCGVAVAASPPDASSGAESRLGSPAHSPADSLCGAPARDVPLPAGLATGAMGAFAAASLAETLPELPERHALLARLLIELAGVLDRFAAEGFAAFADEWQARHAWQGRSVRLLRDGTVECEGICRGAGEDGALLVETASGLQRHLSGDLSLRPA